MFKIPPAKKLEDQSANKGGIAAGAKEMISGSVKLLLSAQCYDVNVIVRYEHSTILNKYNHRIVDAFARLLYVLDSTSDRKNAMCSSIAVVPKHDKTECYLSYKIVQQILK